MLCTLFKVGRAIIFVVALAFSGVLPSPVSAINLTTTVGNSTIWDSIPVFPAASPFESNGVEAQPAATLSTYCIPRTPKFTRQYHNATASAFNAVTVTKTMTVTIVSGVPAPNSISGADGSQDTAHYMNEIAVGLQDIVSGQTNIANSESNAVHGGDISDPAATSSATSASSPLSVDMAFLGLPGGTFVFLNNTTTTYMLVNHANASVVFWTSPVDASNTASNAHFRRLVIKINVWFPYFEALGILTLVYKVGKFIYNRVQKRRNPASAPQGA